MRSMNSDLIAETIPAKTCKQEAQAGSMQAWKQCINILRKLIDARICTVCTLYCTYVYCTYIIYISLYFMYSFIYR
jgi:hypothetical protein